MPKAAQKYEIYINKRLLILMSETYLSDYQTDSSYLVMPYLGIKKNLFQYMDMLEKSNRFSAVVLFTSDLHQLFQDFLSLVTIFPAGGGIIRNQEQKILMIFRRGLWDLPKGKLDPEEKFFQAAVRECEEETGLQQLELVKKFKTSYHLYRDKNYSRCLKKTKWYLMNYFGADAPVPQISESIEGIGWFGLKEALQLNPIHESIKDLLVKYYKYLSKKSKMEN